MLRAIRVGWIGFLTLVVLAGAGGIASAYYEPPPGPPPSPGLKWRCGDYSCWWAATVHVTPPSKPGHPGTPGKHRKQTEAKTVCEFDGDAQKCLDTILGYWSNEHQCYLRRSNPQPPAGDPSWEGHTDGSIWDCTREQGYHLGRHLVVRKVWLPGRPETVVPDPEVLVYEAIAEMKLAPPLIKTAPGVGQIGLVNMPVWLWVTKTENTWGPIVRSASVPGLSVTATAQVKAINWSMGDGKTVRCEGPGTPYDKSMGVKGSPTCGHRYVKTSEKLANCKYPVTAVAQWDITWQSTLGDSGQIAMTQQAATQLRIGQAVPVLVDPNGGEAVAPSTAAC